MASRLFTFVGGSAGAWRVDSALCITGDPLPHASCVSVCEGSVTLLPDAVWSLRGMTSHERYVVRAERTALVSTQEGLGRPASTCAALIPVKKSAEWWVLTQDERRHVFEEQSRHIAIGMTYLPAIARRLHHCRDLGPDEPFDFLTWFEYRPEDVCAFDDLVRELRASQEWSYVERETDIRLVRT